MNQDKTRLLDGLRGIDEYEFERFIAELWEKQGWDTTVTQGSNDRGVDIIAETDTPFPQKHLIQAKRYAQGNKIGSPDVQQYSSLRQQESNADAVIVITTSSFTSQAVESGDILNVKLIDGDGLYTLIQEHNAEDVVGEYLPSGTEATGGSQGRSTDEPDDNWAEDLDEIYAELTEDETVYDLLSRTGNKDSFWPRNLRPVSDPTEIETTIMRCINDVFDQESEGIIKWDAGDFEYAIGLKHTTTKAPTIDVQAGADISIEIAKKERFGGGVDLAINDIPELPERFGYQLEPHSDGPFTSIIASKSAFDDELTATDEMLFIEYIIENMTDQSIQSINSVSVVDPEQF